MIGVVTDEQTTPIRHVMFDADGVLQHCPGGWIAAAEPHFGPRTMEFLQQSYDTQLPTLAGDGDHLELLAALLAEYGVTAPVDEVFRDVWLRIEPAAAVFALVAALRERGYGVHLGTNQ